MPTSMKHGGNNTPPPGVYLSGGRRMFEQNLIVDGGARRNPWSFAVSVTVQSVLVAAALAVPLLHVAQLERKLPEVLFLPRPIGLPEAVQKTVARNSTVSSSTILQSNRSYRPFQAPTKI